MTATKMGNGKPRVQHKEMRNRHADVDYHDGWWNWQRNKKRDTQKGMLGNFHTIPNAKTFRKKNFPLALCFAVAILH